MLPLGRPEDQLVLAVLISGSKRRKNPAAGGISTSAKAMELAVRPVDFFFACREAPDLWAELCVQASVLDFILAGHNPLYDMQIGEEESQDGGQAAGTGNISVVPSVDALNAFVCVGKLKLCRLAAARVARAEEDGKVSAQVFYGILGKTATSNLTQDITSLTDVKSSAYIGPLDMQRFLRKHKAEGHMVAEDWSLILDVGNLDLEDDGSREAAERLHLEGPSPRPRRQAWHHDDSDDDESDSERTNRQHDDDDDDDDEKEDEELSSCVKPLLDCSDFTRLLSKPPIRTIAGLLVSALFPFVPFFTNALNSVTIVISHFRKQDIRPCCIVHSLMVSFIVLPSWLPGEDGGSTKRTATSTPGAQS
jgi:hypothetical protein